MSDLVAIVTGGSGGIGGATCRALAANGATVLVGYRSNQAGAEKVADACEGDAEAVVLDVTDQEQIEAAVDRATELGRLAVVVNAAGITDDDLLMRLTPDRWDRTLSVNLRGAYLTTRAALRPMLRGRWGRVINVGSFVGLRGNAGQTAYAAAKAGLIGLTKSLARELAGKGVTVNLVAPGFVETDMTDELPDDVREGYVERTPIGRPVRAEEVAAAIAFLASEPASAITGAVVPVDGGAAI
ncbi:MAG TPA: 3-oxoacyl-ACP reductase family protein [Nitriliruptorales bacterium]|nr:3-oxoacyl-ACP reductase family protein [Nitriliruptorales bacterium]